jgi:flagellar biosynthetic protein FliQ
MDEATLLDLLKEALYLVILFISMIVMPGLLVGLVISVFQAATQINEQTLNFIPRLIVTVCSIIIFSPLLAQKMVNFSVDLIKSIPGLIG